jgi:hypothetical protein
MDYLEYLLKEYKERMDYLTDGLARGHIKSMDEYSYVCGQLRGLEAASGVIQDLRTRMENSDNE